VTRAFVAVRLPAAVLDAVAGRLSGLSIPGRPATRGQWHLTLQFLGDHADVDAVAAALDALEVSGGAARVGRAGAFPDPRRARVLWLGLTEGAEMVGRVATAVALRTRALGHETEARAFHPHVTIARCRVPTDVRAAVSTLGDEAIGPAWAVEAVTVYESQRRSDGARYVARASIPLRPLPLSS
jgi:2'-5' RNA ligase